MPAFFVLLSQIFFFGFIFGGGINAENNYFGVKIINPEFHPTLSKVWTIFFETKGKADLAVRPLDEITLEDIAFDYIACQGVKIAPIFEARKGIAIKNWQCPGQGAIVYHLKNLGNHELAFNFGGQIALAHNSSLTEYDYSVSSSVTRGAYYGKDFATSVPVGAVSSSWKTAGVEFTSAMYTNINSSNNVYATTTDTASSSFKQIIHDFYIKINEATNTVTQIDLTWEGRGSKNEETGAENDILMYMYDKTNSAWRPINSSLDNACNSSDCTLTYATTIISNYFDKGKGLRFLVQKYEAGHNCSSSPTTITCGKKETSSPSGGCIFQSNSEDSWAQCATSSNSCLTGNCLGTDFSCGWWTDSAQHFCATCKGCNTASPSCGNITANYADSQSYGCTTGQCYSCASGSCDNTGCEGLQCGCDAGNVCSAGTCVPSTPPNCTAACAGFSSGTCVPNIPTCLGIPTGTPDGNSLDCPVPNLCCCVP